MIIYCKILIDITFFFAWELGNRRLQNGDLNHKIIQFGHLGIHLEVQQKGG